MLIKFSDDEVLLVTLPNELKMLLLLVPDIADTIGTAAVVVVVPPSLLLTTLLTLVMAILVVVVVVVALVPLLLLTDVVALFAGEFPPNKLPLAVLKTAFPPNLKPLKVLSLLVLEHELLLIKVGVVNVVSVVFAVQLGLTSLIPKIDLVVATVVLSVPIPVELFVLLLSIVIVEDGLKQNPPTEAVGACAGDIDIAVVFVISFVVAVFTSFAPKFVLFFDELKGNPPKKFLVA